jgi:hypothetical protein
MRRKSSIWAFLLTIFLAVGAVVSVLPGCGDDNVNYLGDSDTGRVPDGQIPDN